MNAPLFIASDHAGYALKSHLLTSIDLAKYHRKWKDLGPINTDSVDYPVYAKTLCKEVIKTFDRKALLEPCGILICGSGVGVSIAANRFPKIRAALCWSQSVAQLSRNHNASNVLCLSERLIDKVEAEKIVLAWLDAKFEGGRHERRIDLIDQD